MCDKDVGGAGVDVCQECQDEAEAIERERQAKDDTR